MLWTVTPLKGKDNILVTLRIQNINYALDQKSANILCEGTDNSYGLCCNESTLL